jgi:hypothetical protein
MQTRTRTKLLVLFAGAAGMWIASAKSYRIIVPDHTEMAGTQLKAGDYTVKVDGAKAVLIGEDDKRVEATGTIQTADRKFPETTLEINKGSDGINHVTAIDLGGTTTRLTFSR